MSEIFCQVDPQYTCLNNCALNKTNQREQSTLAKAYSRITGKPADTYIESVRALKRRDYISYNLQVRNQIFDMKNREPGTPGCLLLDNGTIRDIAGSG